MKRNKQHGKCFVMDIRQNSKNQKKTYEKPGRDSRGSSLIEVIVAMLILAIIIVPMLDMFGNAARINGTARSSQYANTVLENVLEELRAENFTLVYDIADAASEDLRDIGNQLRLCSSSGDDGVLSGKSFMTAVMQQGTKEYQAKLKFSADGYRGGGGLNDYRMPDINSYDSSNSEMLLLDAESDSVIVEEFYRQYEAQEYAEYQHRLNEAWMASPEYQFRYEFDKWYENWQKDHTEEPPADYKPPAFDSSEVPPSNPLSPEEFRSFIHKRTEIRIESSGFEDYGVNYTVSYYVSATAAELRLEEDFNESYQYEAGSGSRFTAEKLDFIYIFYQPFTDNKDQEELVINAREISLEEDWSSRIFLAVQGGSNGVALPVEVMMDDSLSPAECAARLEILTDGGLDSLHTNVKHDLVPDRDPEDTVYRVTVQILEQGNSEVVAEAETTIYYE